MTAAEIAQLLEDEWDEETESLDAFCLRRLPNEDLATFVRALELSAEIVAADINF